MALPDTPAGMIARLDAALVRRGQDIVLQRLSTDEAGVQTMTDQVDPCRAAVRAHAPQELDPVSGEAPETTVIISPSSLIYFPGLPVKDDRLIIGGKPNNVETVSPILVGGTLVRIDMTCRE